jgi:Protein of unknown function (DUF742)
MGVASPPGPQRPHPAPLPTRLAGRPAEPPGGEAMDLAALVVAAEPGERDANPAGLSPADRTILGSCREPVTVAEVALATGLPVSVVRVRLADLIRRGRVTLQAQPPAGEQAGHGLLNEVLDRLRTL